MRDTTFRKEQLDNGIRVVAESIPSVKSVSLGIWVRVGSRDEEAKDAGISHFTEHMFFKGTAHRSAHDISLEMDSLGGELNAFTTRETTTFYVKVLDEHIAKGIEIISDLFLHSSMNRKDMEKEKQVVLEELKMVEDDPEDYIHDMHAKLVWDGNPLARPIVGSVETIKGLNRESMLGFIGIHYHPANIVISAAGNFEFSNLLKLLNKSFGKLRRKVTDNKRTNPELKNGIVVKNKSIEQVHLCLGTLGLPQNDKKRYALYALNSILGSSMSSRLFQEVREKRGLVYSIYSYLSSFTDSGVLNIYAGTSKESLPVVLELILKEIKKIRRNGISRKEMIRVKNQMKGNLMLGLESTSNRMSRIARDEIYSGRFYTTDDIIKEINRITPSQIQGLVNDLFKSEYLSLAILGPVKKDVVSGDILKI
ncbi:MAG TPA: pitrilysin family protein [Nitrospirota bacterium]|nr:pitrilysin family protein [Nitrospirota bacterium]